LQGSGIGKLPDWMVKALTKLDTLIIRPLCADEYQLLWDFLYDALFVPDGCESFPRSILQEPSISHYAAGFGTLPGDVGVVADIGGRVVGAAWLRRLCGNPKGFGYLDDDTPELSVSVRSEYRNQGVGTALIKALLSDCSRVSLSVQKANAALHLYGRCGFKVERVRETDCVMLYERG
jgi:GNAT superfamily N-acetyltransferase